MREGEAPAEPDLQHNRWLPLGRSLAIPCFRRRARVMLAGRARLAKRG